MAGVVSEGSVKGIKSPAKASAKSNWSAAATRHRNIPQHRDRMWKSKHQRQLMIFQDEIIFEEVRRMMRVLSNFIESTFKRCSLRTRQIFLRSVRVSWLPPKELACPGSCTAKELWVYGEVHRRAALLNGIDLFAGGERVPE